jgi:uncharacterized protein YndB with AHSA1/START domain/uncharacterized protein YciI
MSPLHFFVELLGTRPGWPDQMTSDEEKIMSEHFAYLRKLTAQKKVLMAGPVFGNVFGLVILQADTREEAEAIMAAEPSVVQGVHTFSMRPMRCALLAHHVPSDRYVAEPTTQAIVKTVEVAGALAAVWTAWTTGEGARTFFSSNVDIDLRPGGRYEVLFRMESPEGQRGSEDCRVLSYLPNSMLSLEWNAPPDFGELRDQRTIIVIEFQSITPDRTRVRLTHHGWGDGEEWQKLFLYFDRAWTYVLGNLKKRFDTGPLNWNE